MEAADSYYFQTKMKTHTFLSLLILSYFGSPAQDSTSTSTSASEWNGDSTLCTVDLSAPIINNKPLPSFPIQAEFTLERVEVKHITNITLPIELTLYHDLYEYNGNKLILITNKNGSTDMEYFYYGKLKKFTYYCQQFCVVEDIPTNIDMSRFKIRFFLVFDKMVRQRFNYKMAVSIFVR